MKAEIVLTGTELLLGEIVDTNSVMMAKMLREIGLDLYYKSTVGDNQERITAVLRHALDRVDIVLVSGGLGPTVDDVTRQAAAAATDRELVYSTELEAQIAARFRKFGREMAENNKRQAWIPEGAIPVENPVGTAPCFIVESEQGTIICLPGVPRELKYQMENAIIPYLKGRLGKTQIIKARILRTCAIGESDIDRRIDDLMRLNNPTVGLAAHLGQVDIRITAKAATSAEADILIAPIEAELRNRLGEYIFGVDQESLAGVVGALLKAHNLKLALADTIAAAALSQALQEAGCQAQVELPLVADSVDSLLSQLSIRVEGTNPDHAALVTRIGQHLSQSGGIGLAIVGPLAAADNDSAVLIALSHGDQVEIKQYQYTFADQARRGWLIALAFDQLRRHLLKL